MFRWQLMKKHKMILDYEVTNEVKDTDQLSKIATRAKEILEVEKIRSISRQRLL
ncbi:MAG: hypothetical protein KIIPBIDF_02129 [Candidatus Methanoperedenaceae archaeon GB50]|nr:MAG: hypothetical protein KIIPBIDF_02129 [Candidatus Methanoperedenaceae archaeon GB50]